MTIAGSGAAEYVERLVLKRTRSVLYGMLAELADAEIAAGLGQDLTPAGVAATGTVHAVLVDALGKIAAGVGELRDETAQQGARELDRAEAEIGL